MGNGQLMSILYEEEPHAASIDEAKEQLQRLYYTYKSVSHEEASTPSAGAGERKRQENAESSVIPLESSGKASPVSLVDLSAGFSAAQEDNVELWLNEEQAWHLIATKHPHNIQAQAAEFYGVTVRGESLATLQERVTLSFHSERKRFLARMRWYDLPVIEQLLAAQKVIAQHTT